IQEEDGLFLQGLERSVGAIIKSSAISLYPNYYQDNTSKQSITLGLNSILDLSYNYSEAQSGLFTPDQCRKLRTSLAKKGKARPLAMNPKVEKMLCRAESLAENDIIKASDYIYKYLYQKKQVNTRRSFHSACPCFYYRIYCS
ncbi:uncharacterized protein EV154DRAFT_423497, partial [Mucor mucedo]|uniref:uncharacterized protein n=1 Tax=Mucor mucedo TaxID=29922 RepID=UPI00221E4E64